jgi:hypothetical protein
LIDWVSKKQATIETSVFGAEFVAIKHGIEKLQGLRYKLCMMGIPLTGPARYPLPLLAGELSDLGMEFLSRNTPSIIADTH